MSPKVLEYVQKIGSKRFPQGHVIFNEGAMPDNTMFFVFRGEVGIFKVRPGGQEEEINRIGPGNFFGEMALVHTRNRLATARVLSEEAHMAVINKEMLLRLAGSSPQFIFYLMRYSIGRLLAAEDKLQRVREELAEEKRRRGIY